MLCPVCYDAEGHRELRGEADGKHVRSAGWQEDDRLHRRHQHAGHQRLGRPGRQRDRPTADGDEGLLQSRKARRLYEHRRRAGGRSIIRSSQTVGRQEGKNNWRHTVPTAKLICRIDSGQI